MRSLRPHPPGTKETRPGTISQGVLQKISSMVRHLVDLKVRAENSMATARAGNGLTDRDMTDPRGQEAAREAVRAAVVRAAVVRAAVVRVAVVRVAMVADR